MATVTILSNASQATDVTIGDIGVIVPSGGGSITFTTVEENILLQKSEDLRALLVDDAHGAGSSTLILNDGTSNIAQADATDFLDTVTLPDASNEFGVVKNDSAGQITSNLTFDGTATVTNLVAGGNIDLNSNKITNLAAPTADNDAARKVDVDAATQGLDVKESVRAATTASLSTWTSSGSGVGKTLTSPDNNTSNNDFDGVTLVVGNRLLVKDGGPNAGVDNGIYEVTQVADGSTVPTILTRTTDFDEDTEVTANAFTFVAEGTTYANTGWVVTTNNPITVDTTSITWTQFTGAGTIIAGAGLTKTGDTIDVGAGNGIIVNADDVEVDYGELGDIASLGTTASAGVLNEAARADHVHTHGDRGVDGATSQHDADQVDVENTYNQLPNAPSDLETVVGDVNTALSSGQWVGKYLPFGASTKIPGSGTLYLASGGGVVTSATGIRMLRGGVISGASIEVDAADATNAYKLSIKVNGTEVSSVALSTSTTGNTSVALSGSFSAGDTLSVSVERTSGSGTSDFSEIQAVVELNESNV